MGEMLQRILSGLGLAVGIPAQIQGTNEARAQDEADIQEIRDLFGGVGDRIFSGEQSDRNAIRVGGQQLVSDLQDATAADLNDLRFRRNETLSGFADVMGGIRGDRDLQRSLLDQVTDQDRRDLEEQYDGLSSEQAAFGASRGLTGSTIVPSLQMGVERERTGARNRLSDSRLRERLDLEDRFSTRLEDRGFQGVSLSDALRSDIVNRASAGRGSAISARANTRSDLLNNARGARDARNQLDLGLASFIGGIENVPPDFLPYLQALGGGLVEDPDTPSTGSQLAPGLIEGGSAIASSAILALALSDREAKDISGEAEASAVLAGVEDLPVYVWRYKDDPNKALHIGPMAQDFREAFGMGSNDRVIALVDAFGVALASIKALTARVADLERAVGAGGLIDG